MERDIKLGSLDIRLHSSIFSIIEYKNVFGKELFVDLKEIESQQTTICDENISTLIGGMLKITYILHRPYCDLSFHKFLMILDLFILANVAELEALSKTIIEMLSIVQKGEISAPQ